MSLINLGTVSAAPGLSMGYSVAISGDGSRVAYGQENGNFVRVHEYVSGTTWNISAAILVAGGLKFGNSIALSDDGNCLAVSAPTDVNANTDANAGRVHFYLYNGAWPNKNINSFDISGAAANDELGTTMAMTGDGSHIVVGSSTSIGTPYTRVYQTSNGGINWAQIGGDIPTAGASISISADGTRVAIGSTTANDVKIYDYSGTWNLVKTITINSAVSSIFGNSVSLSNDGTRIAIGAQLGVAPTFSGSVFVYEESDNWTNPMAGSLTDATGTTFAIDRYGWSVSLSGDGSRLIVGAPESTDSGTASGVARVYYDDGGTWTLFDSIDDNIGGSGSGVATGDTAGRSVAISDDGSRVVVGAPFADLNGADSGGAYIAEYPLPPTTTSAPTTTVTPTTTIAPTTTVPIPVAWEEILTEAGTTGGEYGYSVSMNQDGTRVVIGEPGYNGNFGRATIYSVVGNTLVPMKFGDVNTDATFYGSGSGDRLGESVSMTADGNGVLIGAPGVNSSTGSVSFYQYDTAYYVAYTVTSSSDVGTNTGDRFGAYVDIEQGYAVVGAPNGLGYARFFVANYGANQWSSFTADIVGDNGSVSGILEQSLGKSVAVYPDSVYTYFALMANRPNEQIVYLYRYGGSVMQLLGTRLGTSPNTSFGGNVALDKSSTPRIRMAFTDGDFDNLSPYVVHTYVYEWDDNITGFRQISSNAIFGADTPTLITSASVSFGLNGTRISIGMPQNNNGTGHVAVYDLSYNAGDPALSTWSLVDTILDGIGVGDKYGFASEISNDGNFLLIGAPEANAGDGTARLFELAQQLPTTTSAPTTTVFTPTTTTSPTTTVQPTTTVVPTTTAEPLTDALQIGGDITGLSSFGYNVAISENGSRIVVGEFTNTNPSGYAYEYNGTSWNLVNTVTFGSGASCAVSVAISNDGTRYAIGAFTENSNAGEVRVYDWGVNVDIHTLNGPVGSNAKFGASIELSGDGRYLVVGADNHQNLALLNTGAIYVYDMLNISSNTVVYGEENFSQFGFAVDISNDGAYIIAGAPYNSGGGSNRGHSRVYSVNYTGLNPVLTQEGADIDGDVDGDSSSYSVAITDDGQRVVIGEPTFSNTSVMSVYDFNGSNWVLETSYSYTTANNELGSGVSITGDGTRMIAGAPADQTSALDGGSAHVLNYDGSSLSLHRNIIEGDANDNTGNDVMISRNGDFAIVGSYGNNYVRVYALGTNTLLSGGVTGGVTSSNFGFGDIGCINNYFVVKGEEFPNDKCDYTITAKCDLNSLFNNNNAQDPDDDGDINNNTDDPGLMAVLSNVCACLEESVESLVFYNANNVTGDDVVIDTIRNDADKYSWKVGSVSGGTQKQGADPLVGDFDDDYTQIANQHFTFKQSTNAGGDQYYAVPRGGLFDKLVRIFLHCTSPFFNEGTLNYHQVSKLISQSFCEHQNEVTTEDYTGYTDIYHKQIAERIVNVINQNNQEFRSKVVQYLETQTPGNDNSDNIDFNNPNGAEVFSLNFCFDYRFQTLNLDDIDINNPGEYNNNCPEDGNTKITVNDVKKTICLTIVHEDAV
jgi:hypothetical protein